MFLLSGCATFGQMEDGLNVLSGKNIQTAFNVLGYPTGAQQFGNDTVYFWTTNHSGGIIIPQTVSTQGYIGRIPVYNQAIYNQYVPMNYSCLLKLITGDSIIKSWEYEGNLGGCTAYIKRLKIYKDSQTITAQELSSESIAIVNIQEVISKSKAGIKAKDILTKYTNTNKQQSDLQSMSDKMIHYLVEAISVIITKNFKSQYSIICGIDTENNCTDILTEKKVEGIDINSHKNITSEVLQAFDKESKYCDSLDYDPPYILKVSN